MTWRDRSVSDLAETLVATPRQRTIGVKTPPRKRAGYRMSSTAMVSAAKMRAAEAVPPAAEMRAAKSMAPAVPTAMAAAVTSSTMAATALGDRGTGQRGHEHNDRNSHHAP
jgi:hypothetical protein